MTFVGAMLGIAAVAAVLAMTAGCVLTKPRRVLWVGVLTAASAACA